MELGGGKFRNHLLLFPFIENNHVLMNEFSLVWVLSTLFPSDDEMIVMLCPVATM